MSRLIDAEGSELQTHLKIIREAEYQIYGSGSWGFTAKCEHAIEDAPTVQPEITHEQAVAYLQSTGWMQEHDRQMMLDGAHRLTTQPESHWIPVTDGLPNIREDVLVSYYDEVMVGWLIDDSTWFAEEYGRLNMNDIAAWMPLPEPYKGATT